MGVSVNTCVILGKNAPGGATTVGKGERRQHTLAECSTWDVLRRDLIKEIGGDFSLLFLIIRIGSEEAWTAFSSFCENIMLRKEQCAATRRLSSMTAEKEI